MAMYYTTDRKHTRNMEYEVAS